MRRVLVACLTLLLAPYVWAQPISESEVPEGLRKWIPWALDGAEERLCPAVSASAVCLWPGRLVLVVGAQGGAFSQDVFSDRTLDLPLAGGDKRWPQSVRLDGKPAAVLDRGGRPAVWLTPGAHKLDGRFVWDRLPDSLPIPAAVAIVDLTVEGRAISVPRREPDGLLLLRQGAAQAGGENLQVKVFRELSDGIPLWLDTRVALEVSGRAREVPLVGVPVEGAVPVAVGGDLPARLDADGRLRVQVRAGSFSVHVLSRLASRPETFALPTTAPPWPTQEVWVFAAQERLRQVQAGGATPIDPSRTDLPSEWRALPAFVMEGESKLTLKEVRRGEPESLPDQLSLARTLWLDEDGGGLTVRDTLNGQLGSTTRLDLAQPGDLGRVTLGGVGQLVTRNPKTSQFGVELRKPTLALQADSRLPRRLALPAVGWSTTVQSLRVQLMLPPGWRLLATSGVDSASGSWASRWNLFGFFFVLLTTMAVGKLFSKQWALIALLALTLDYGEPGAPGVVWLSLVASLALLRVSPAGLLRSAARAWWWASLLVLLLIGAPFLVDQIRVGLFPQVVASGNFAGELADAGAGGLAMRHALPQVMNAPPAPSATEESEVGPQDEQEARNQAFGNTESKDKTAPRKLAARQDASNSLSFSVTSKAYEQDPHAIIQTGVGVPSWSWAGSALTWSGPVDKDQSMQLFLLSPGMNLLLALARVALTLLLALRLVGLRTPLPAPSLEAAAVLALLAHTPVARADDQPSTQLLQELRQRLTRPPACTPHCVTSATLQLLVEGADLRLVAEVHAGATVGWPIPGPAESWVPRNVALDGKSAEGQLARLADGFLHLHIPAGVHQVTITGPLPPRDSVTLQFGERPRHATAAAPGWQVDGIHEDGSADDSVQLSRKLALGATPASREGGYEPWLEVTRILDIGVSWNVTTIVRRISPTGAPVVLKVPLLKGMLVTDGERQVKDGEILVTLGRDETETRWSATLAPVEGDTVTLQAPEKRPWSEVWLVNCGFVWQCDAAGLPPVSRVSNGSLAPEYRPWPGERLSLTFRKPQGALGQTLTIDRASLKLQPGIRKENGTLDLQVRATRTELLALSLPNGTSVQELTVGGVKRPVRPDGGTLNVTVEPGERPVHVAWQGSDGLSLVHRVPAVSLGHAAVNGQIAIELPVDRWLLASHGPSWGPAILFWGYLLFVLLVAAVLARAPNSPLSAWEWLLLGLGLTQVPFFAAIVVAGWFLVLAWRRDRVQRRRLVHNLLQFVLVVWTVLALGFLYAAVHQGLLLRPDMQVAGGGSSDTLLQWYTDRIDGAMPRPWVVSLPLWVYRLLMLAWSLWLALALVRWLPWAWSSFSSGALWAGRPPSDPTPSPESTPLV
jgi:hypothetical protein